MIEQQIKELLQLLTTHNQTIGDAMLPVLALQKSDHENARLFWLTKKEALRSRVLESVMSSRRGDCPTEIVEGFVYIHGEEIRTDVEEAVATLPDFAIESMKKRYLTSDFAAAWRKSMGAE